MHEFTRNEINPELFTLAADVRRSTYDTAKNISVIEGRKFVDTFRKITFVYDEVDTATHGFGVSLHADTEHEISRSNRIESPKQYIKRMNWSHTGPHTLLQVNVAEDTKEIVERQIESFDNDFDHFLTGVVGYYGLLATHLYQEENLLAHNHLKRETTKIVVLE